MEATELRELLKQNKMVQDGGAPNATEEAANKRRMIRDFRMHTGCTVDFMIRCEDDMLMSMWAQFAIERIEEVSK